MALESIFKTLDKIINIDQDAIIENILRDPEFQRFIINLNTEGEATSQLFEQGIDALGKSLGDYAGTTIEGTANFKGKREKGQRFDHITLKDTAKFYKSFRMKVANGGFLLIADPNRGDTNLFNDFGKEVVGLTDENLQIVIDALKDKIIPFILQDIAA